MQVFKFSENAAKALALLFSSVLCNLTGDCQQLIYWWRDTFQLFQHLLPFYSFISELIWNYRNLKSVEMFSSQDMFHQIYHKLQKQLKPYSCAPTFHIKAKIMIKHKLWIRWNQQLNVLYVPGALCLQCHNFSGLCNFVVL